MLERLFEPFAQGKAGLRAGGAGLGLAIVARLAASLNGQVSAHAPEGGRAEFRFEAKLDAAGPAVDDRELSGRKVALIGAGPTLTAAIAMQLKACGAELVADSVTRVAAEGEGQSIRKLADEHAALRNVATLAALMPAPDPQLELRALERTRHELSRAAWTKGLALFFTALPLSFRVSDDTGFQFLFADQPAVVVLSLVVAAGFWFAQFHHGRQAFR